MPISFLYTGAKSFKAAQNDAKNSLGGYISGSPIPSDRVSNIFSNISYNAIKNGKLVETIAIAILNTGGSSVTPVMGIERMEDTPDYDIKLAFVTIDTNVGVMEQILSSGDLPLNAEFATAYDEAVNDSVTLPVLPANGYLGIWISRTITPPQNVDLCTLDENYAPVPDRNFNIKVSY